MFDAARWYEDQQGGLGRAFMLSVDAVLQRIKRHPEMFPVIYKPIRRAVVRRFPYCTYFMVEEQRVVVIAVMHAKRSPSIWKRRV